MSADASPLQVQELAYRNKNKLEVTLWWVKGTLDTYVSVIDHLTDPPTVYDILVKPPNSPNDVFHHPFAYITEPEAHDDRGSN